MHDCKNNEEVAERHSRQGHKDLKMNIMLQARKQLRTGRIEGDEKGKGRLCRDATHLKKTDIESEEMFLVRPARNIRTPTANH